MGLVPLFVLLISPGNLFAIQDDSPPSFLLIHETTAARELWFRLYSAPVLDQDLILNHASRREVEVRTLLVGTRNRLLETFCSSPPDERPALQAGWISTMEGQFSLWKRIEDRNRKMEKRSLQEKMERMLTTPDGAHFLRNSLKELLEKQETVHLMALERQTLMRNNWSDFLLSLEDLPEPENECFTAGQISEEEPDFPPSEELYRPYHLALFRYYSAMPPSLRSRVILARKNS